MKKITFFSFFLYATLAANSLHAMFNNKLPDEKQNNKNIPLPKNSSDNVRNSNNKRINLEEQNDANNKHTKINDDEKITSYNNQLKKLAYENKIINKETIKKEEIHDSSNIQLPQQPQLVCTYPQYNTNTQTTNNVILNIQPGSILNFAPPYPNTPLFIPTPRPILSTINIDQVKQFLANTQYLNQQRQPTHNEEIEYSDTYIFDLNEKNKIKIRNKNIITPSKNIKHIVFKILPLLSELIFLKKQFPCTQKIDASALFGERFLNIHTDQKQNSFDKFLNILATIKQGIMNKNNNTSLLSIEIKKNALDFICNAYIKEPQDPYNNINILLDSNQNSKTFIQHNPQSINNNNTTQSLLSPHFTQGHYTKIKPKQNTPQLHPKKVATIQPSSQRLNNTLTAQNFERNPVQNIRSNSPFAENNNIQNSTKKEPTPLFDTKSFINSILANPNPINDIDDILNTPSESQNNLDFFDNNNTKNQTYINSNNEHSNSYAIQNDTIFVFNDNERILLAQKITLPLADKINELCFKICPTDLEFFELSEFFYNVQKIDFSFVLNTNNPHIKSILQSLKTFKHLKELKLEGNQLTDDIIIWIAKELPHLEALYLDHNFISDKGAEAISQMYCLKTLSLNSNQLTDHGAIVLSGMPDLITFNYDNNLISKSGETKIFIARQEVSFLHNSN